ncbi:hypothetical protein MRX96_022867 [Rhipicephalus microplus]
MQPSKPAYETFLSALRIRCCRLTYRALVQRKPLERHPRSRSTATRILMGLAYPQLIELSGIRRLWLWIGLRLRLRPSCTHYGPGYAFSHAYARLFLCFLRARADDGEVPGEVKEASLWLWLEMACRERDKMGMSC